MTPEALAAVVNATGGHRVLLMDKKPVSKGWQKRGATDAEVAAHLKADSSSHIGIAPASVGIVCVDIDRGGEDAAAWVREACGEPLEEYASSPGKLHMLYRAGTPFGRIAFRFGEVIHGAENNFQVRLRGETASKWLRAKDMALAGQGRPFSRTALLSKKPGQSEALPPRDPWGRGSRNNTLSMLAFKAHLESDDPDVSSLVAKARESGLSDREIAATVQSAKNAAPKYREAVKESNHARVAALLGESLRESSFAVCDGELLARDEALGTWKRSPTNKRALHAWLTEWAVEVLELTTIPAISRFRAETEIYLTLESNSFDQDPDCAGLPEGGALDLIQGSKAESGRESRVSMRLGVTPDFDESRSPATWLRFLADVLPHEECVDWLQRYLGYSLTGRTAENLFLFVYGTGANGKSTLVRTVTEIAGDYAAPVNKKGLVNRHGVHAQWLAALQNIRIGTIAELPADGKWDTDTLKELTGDDWIVANRMRHDDFRFKPKLKLILSGNQMPSFEHVDEAIRRRVALMKMIRVPPEKRDTGLAEKLKAEYPLIAAWMVRGAARWRREGLRPLPDSIDSPTKEYLGTEDWFEDFLEKVRVTGSGEDWLAMDELMMLARESWHRRARPTDVHNTLDDRLGKRTWAGRKQVDGKRVRVRFGLKE